jgi:predicted acetyltransferase
MQLKIPSLHYLPHYADALRRGWSPDNLRDEVRLEQLHEIENNPEAFAASLDDPEAKGPPIALPDGSVAQRLPGFQRWLWDGEFCGSIGFRWKPGTPELPPTCLGHIGYAVVPWKRGKGYATAALRLILPEAWSVGLPYVEITTGPSNEPSQRVIVANGGILIEKFRNIDAHGGAESLRFRIPRPEDADIAIMSPAPD